MCASVLFLHFSRKRATFFRYPQLFFSQLSLTQAQNPYFFIFWVLSSASSLSPWPERNTSTMKTRIQMREMNMITNTLLLILMLLLMLVVIMMMTMAMTTRFDLDVSLLFHTTKSRETIRTLRWLTLCWLPSWCELSAIWCTVAPLHPGEEVVVLLMWPSRWEPR